MTDGLYTYLLYDLKIGIIQMEFNEKHIDEILRLIEYCTKNRNNSDLWNIKFDRQVFN